MLTIAIASLSGGQGKTTTTLFLARKLALSYPTLVIDADPQHNLTTYLGLELQPNQPTLLEFLKKSVPFEDTIYPVEALQNLFLIPADDHLDNANEYLSSSGMGAMMLSRRLEPLVDSFKLCLIDSPPQRSQIAKTVIGAANFLVIPAEANIKGYGSLVRTLDLLDFMQEMKATTAELMAVIPFRDKWVGLNQTQESRLAIKAMKEEVKEKVFPSIRESEKYKQAINKQLSLSTLGKKELEYPFDVLVAKIQEQLK
ncbi:MAG: ParA family protein [Xenococcaceae cyanobacterium MO_207.B15]|nr:ParA family protein [Xenococcaceae cyanobacterium MO_207.B15]